MNNENKDGISNSDGIYYSRAISNSNGIYYSYGVADSRAISVSNGVADSRAISVSNGISNSNCISVSNGVADSRAIYFSDGISNSYGIYDSYGICGSEGVTNHIFCANKKKEYKLFKDIISESRFNEVMIKINELNDGWFPKTNNAFELYVGSGKEWSKVDASKIKSTKNIKTQPINAWQDMPQATVDYIRSLDEYDADIFNAVTGLNDLVDTKEVTLTLTEDQIADLKRQGIL